MENEITLIDRGRGLQFSTSRITVHDLVPYSQGACSYDEIIRWIPGLTHEEIAVVERYCNTRTSWMSTNVVSRRTARSKFGCNGFVSPSRKEAAVSAWLV
jgi:hypothetical protein